MPKRIARLCWNENGWERPSGSVKSLESGGSFAAQYGFGFEEWLYSPETVVDGWRHGFIQGVNRSF